MSIPPIRRALGWYEAAAGVSGIAITLYGAPSVWRQAPPEFAGQVMLLILGCIAIFAALILAGIELVAARPLGFRLSAAMLFAQIPILSVGHWRWTFFGGAYAALIREGEPWSVAVGIKALITAAWSGRDLATYFGVNFVPILLLVILWTLRREAMPPRPPNGPA